MDIVKQINKSFRDKKKERPSLFGDKDKDSEETSSSSLAASGSGSGASSSKEGKTGLKKSNSLRKSNPPLGVYLTGDAPAANAPMPSKEQVDSQLEELMSNLGFEETQKNAMRLLPLDSKWKMIQSNNTISNIEKKKKDEGDDSTTPEFFINRMNSKAANPALLKGLWISIKSQRMKWLISFLEIGGLRELLYLVDDVCRKANKKPADLETLHYVILALKALMNNKHGIKAVLQHEGALDIIAMALDAPHLQDKSLVLEILIGICYVEKPKGHFKVLKAMDHFKDFKKEDARFRSIVNNIGANCFHVEEKDVIDFLVNSMLFINAIINVPDDLSFRIHLRNEFFALEFGHIFDKLKQVKTNYTQNQVTIFENYMKEDLEELMDFYDNNQCDFQEPNSVFQRLHQSVVGTAAFKPFLSLFQGFLMIRSFQDARRNYWSLINQVFTQVILDKKGIDPDFSTKYKIPVQELIDGFARKDQYKQILEEIKEAKSKVDSCDRDLEKLNVQWTENFEQTKAKFVSQIDALKAAGAKPGAGADPKLAIDTSSISADNAASILPLVQDENNRMKKLINELKEKKDVDQLLKSLSEGGILIEKIAPPPGPPGGGAPPPPPPPGGFPGAPPPPPPPGGFGGPPPPPPPPGGFGGPPPPPPPPGGFPGAPPPPPPPGGFGGPPPPPPPGGFPGGPPPPPPPGGFGPPPPPGFGPPPPGFGAPAAPKFIASGKMKNIHWDKIAPTSLQETVWEKVKIDEQFYRKNVDFKEFEELFAAKASADPKDGGAKKPIEKKPDLISVVDPKKAYNCSLMLGLLKMSNPEIRKAILSIDEENQLSDNTVTQLLNYLPSSDEIQSLQPYKNDPTKLAAADQFMLAISDIPKLENRLNSMVFKRSYHDKMSDIRPGIEAVTSAARALKSSKAFHKILELVLLLGNYMNGTGRSGGAAGFKLAAINKLTDTKSADNKLTLLHFIVGVIERKFPEVMQFQQELADVDPASKTSFATMQAEMNELRVGLKKIEKELEDYQKPLGPGDNFKGVFQPFVDKAKTDFEELDKKFKRMEEAFQAALKFYAEDAKTPPEEFFAMVLKFLELFKQAKKENDDRAEQQAKEMKKQQAAAEREERKKTRGIRSIGLDNIDGAGDDEKGVLDDMLQSLKSGEAYEGKEKKKKKERRKKADSDDEIDAEAMLKQLQSN